MAEAITSALEAIRQSPRCKAAIEILESTKSPWPYPARRDWAHEMERDLKAQYKCDALFFVYRADQTHRLERAPFWSLADFFSELGNLADNHMPIVACEGKPAPAKLIALRTDGQAAAKAATELFTFPGPTEISFLMQEVSRLPDY